MKNTLITIASVAALAVSANAQTYAAGQTSTFASDSLSGTLNSTNITVTGTFHPASPSNAAFYGFTPAASGDRLVTANNAGGSTLTHTLSFASPVADLWLAINGVDNSSVIFDQNFTTRVSSGISSPGNDITSSGSNGSALIQFDAPVSTLSFTTQGNDAVFIGLATDVTVTPVPEPSGTALLGLGGLALLIRRKRS